MSFDQKTLEIKSLRFEGITLKHEGYDPLFVNCDFDFPMNSVVWIESDEGAGKSSLLQMMAGLQSPNSGKFLINEENVSEMSFEEFLPYRLQIGYSFDYGGLISNRTIYDNLILPLNYHKLVTPEQAKERVDEMIKTFELGKFVHERPAHVPGRVRKLVCLLRSLVMHPQVLLMDDPSVGLGQDTVYHFVDYLHKLRKEGHLSHMFISSYDEKFMGLFDYKKIHINESQIYLGVEPIEKKVLNL